MRTLPNAVIPLLLSFALVSCGQAEEEKKEKVVEAVAASITTVQQAGQNDKVVAVGTVRLRRETSLGFTTAGKVATVRYEEGANVKRGALIAALDTTTVQADLSMAAAERDRTTAELARMEKLFKDGWVTKARLEAAQAATQAANARISAAGFTRNTARLVAPSNGIILTRNIDPGQIVSPGMTAIILGQTDKGFVLRTPVTDSDAARMRVGMGAKATLTALGGQELTAVISEINGRADATTGSFEVSFQLPAHAKLRSGQIGTATIALPKSQSDLTEVPPTALFGLRAGEGLVFVVDTKTNIVTARTVQVNELTDSNLLISAGLSAGETIVATGVEKLKSGMKIRSNKPKPVQKAGPQGE